MRFLYFFLWNQIGKIKSPSQILHTIVVRGTCRVYATKGLDIDLNLLLISPLHLELESSPLSLMRKQAFYRVSQNNKFKYDAQGIQQLRESECICRVHISVFLELVSLSK